MTAIATSIPRPGHGARVEALLDALAEADAQISAGQARKTALLAEAVDIAQEQARDAVASGSGSASADIPLRSIAAQIGAALRVSDRTVQRQLSDAVVLVERFGATLTAWAAGEVSRGHVQVIADAGTAIDDDDARAVFEAAALEVARRETPGRLRAAARLLAARVHPFPLQERHRVAAARRDVWVRDLDDGIAELIAVLPAAIAHGIRDRLDQYARRTVEARRAVSRSGSGGGAGPVRDDAAAADGGDASHDHDTLVPDAAPDDPRAADTRRVGEVRADVFADLLLTGHATPDVSNDSIPAGEAIVAHVQVTLPALTALGHDDTPAELVGKAPIDTATALRLAGTASGWDRVLTHPVTGTVLAVDRYRPPDHLTRALRVRDEHCRFPGCRMPTRRCDIDHTVAREHDGPTALTNLAHLCRRHHTLKHHSAWRVRQTPDGILHWTSPTGRTYPDQPARTLTFTTTEPPDAGDPPDPPPF